MMAATEQRNRRNHYGNRDHGHNQAVLCQRLTFSSEISIFGACREILVSDIVRGLARTSAGVAFEDRGEHEL